MCAPAGLHVVGLRHMDAVLAPCAPIVGWLDYMYAYVATCMRPVCFLFLTACAPAGLHVVVLRHMDAVLASGALIVGWLDCMYAYVATCM